MGISYKKLWALLIEKDITRAQMRRDLKIATGMMSDICSVVKPKKEDTV